MTRLKDRTLKNLYEKNASSLSEAVDPNKVQQIQTVLASLDNIVPDGANILNKAIEAAKNDIGTYLQSGLKQVFSSITGDPVAKSSSLANAVRAGLSQLPTIAKLYLPKGSENETQKSIMELVPKEKQQELIKSVAAAFEPAGSSFNLKNLFTGHSMPYVASLNMAVQELLQNVAPNGAFKLGQQASAQQNVDVQSATPSEKPSATGTVPTKQTDVAKTAQGTAPTVSSQDTQKSQTSTTGKRVTVNDTAAINDMATYLSKKAGVDQASLVKVLTQLAKDQKLLA